MAKTATEELQLVIKENFRARSDRVYETELNKSVFRGKKNFEFRFPYDELSLLPLTREQIKFVNALKGVPDIAQVEVFGKGKKIRVYFRTHGDYTEEALAGYFGAPGFACRIYQP